MATVSTYYIWWEDADGVHTDSIQALSAKDAVEFLGVSPDAVDTIAREIKNWR